LQTIRERVPGMPFVQHYIAGHPGRTEEDFDEMMGFVEKFRFDSWACSRSSHEDKYPSTPCPANVPADIKQERVARIMEITSRHFVGT